MHSTRFTAEINRLRAALRDCQAIDLIPTVQREVERMRVATLVADNAQRYVAGNASAAHLTGYSRQELIGMTVTDLTPVPQTEAGRELWQSFISNGGQRGEYELVRKDRVARRVRYWAFASIAPGLHVSLLVPSDGADSGLQ